MKRIPRIKFPKRHPQPDPPSDAKSTSQVTNTSSSQMIAGTSEVPSPPRGYGGGRESFATTKAYSGF